MQGVERPGPPAVIWALAIIFAAVEIAMVAADALADVGPGGISELRYWMTIHFAFLDLLFEAVREGASPPWFFWTSFVTYAFLHGGTLHLVMNGAIFLALGGAVANMIGPMRFLIFFAVTAVAGALAFALITDAQGPMVGASGVIFGLFGALKRWEWRWIRATGAPANRFWGTIIALTVMNVALFFLFPGGGSIAWEAHLGGFVAGWLIAPFLAPGRAAPSPI
ncbi:MAG: rhomboid family intramembrane serine protease [Pseudomonadota bacterium]